MLELLYFVVWQCLFLCWSAYDQLQKIFSRLHSVLSWSYDRCGGVEVDASASVSVGRATSLIVAAKERLFLQKCKNDLTKLPKHLSVIVGPEAYQVKELLIQKLFTYANIMDIDYISLYDTRPPNKGYIDVEHMKVPKGVQFKVIEENYFQWCSVEYDDELSNNVGSNGYKIKSNGYVTESNGCEVNGNSKKRDYSVHKKLEVYQITEADCRPMLAKVCRELFTKRHTPEVQKLLRGEREHLTQYITEQLRHRLNAPEPELCILLHKDLCTFGLLPWQTRFTEFYAHDPQSGQFSAQDFAGLLYKYSNCEQRWGK